MIDLVFYGVLLGAGYFVGNYREKAHYKSIIEREAKLLSMPVQTGKKYSGDHRDCKFVDGSVVIASDYFKDFAGKVRNFFGGNVTALDSLMDRARREAVLRVKESAASWGADEVLGLRIEFCSLDKMGVEVIAYGTAVKK